MTSEVVSEINEYFLDSVEDDYEDDYQPGLPTTPFQGVRTKTIDKRV